MNPSILRAITSTSWNGVGSYHSFTIKPARVTKPGGTPTPVYIARRYVTPPETEIRKPNFVYYQIGEIFPGYLGVEEFIKDKWMSLEKLMCLNDTLIDVVLENGRSITPKDCWLKKAGIDHNYILAILVNPTFDYGETIPYLLQEIRDYILHEAFGRIPINGYAWTKDLLAERTVYINFKHNPLSYHREAMQASTLKNNKTILSRAENPNTLAKVNEFLAGGNPEYTAWVNYNGRYCTLNYAKRFSDNLVKKEVAIYTDFSVIGRVMFKNIEDYKVTVDDKTVYVFPLPFEMVNTDTTDVFIGTTTGTDEFIGYNAKVGFEKKIYQLGNKEIGVDGDVVYTIRSLNSADKKLLENTVIYFVVRRSIKKDFNNTATRYDLIDKLTLEKRIELQDKEFIGQTDFNLLEVIRHSFNKSSKLALTDISEKDFCAGLGYTGINRAINPYPALPIRQYNDGGKHVAVFDVPVGVKALGPRERANVFYEAMFFNVNGIMTGSKYFHSFNGGIIDHADETVTGHADVILSKYYISKISFHKKYFGDVIIDDTMKDYGYGCYVTTSASQGFWSIARNGLHYTIYNNVIKWNTGYLSANGLTGAVVKGGVTYHSIIDAHPYMRCPGIYNIPITMDDDNLPGISPAVIEIYADGRRLIYGMEYYVEGSTIVITRTLDRRCRLQIRMHGVSPTGTVLEPIAFGIIENGRLLKGINHIGLGFHQSDIVSIKGSFPYGMRIPVMVPTLCSVYPRVSPFDSCFQYINSVDLHTAEVEKHQRMVKIISDNSSQEVEDVKNTDPNLNIVIASMTINLILSKMLTGWTYTGNLDKSSMSATMVEFSDAIKWDMDRIAKFGNGQVKLTVSDIDYVNELDANRLSFILKVSEHYLGSHLIISANED